MNMKERGNNKEEVYTQYVYYNQFHLTDKLKDAMTTLISENEGNDYVCEVVDCKIPKHKESVIEYPNFHGEVNMSGKIINALQEKHGRTVTKEIKEKKFTYMVIGKSEAIEDLQTKRFENEEEIKAQLKCTTGAYAEYDGVFNPEAFSYSYPYLKTFFRVLNEWRFQNNKAILDDSIIAEALVEGLASANTKETKKVFQKEKLSAKNN